MWMSKKQSCVALSSTETEYMVVSTTTQESSWLEMLDDDLCLQSRKPMTIHCDNEASIKMATNPKIAPKTKHMVAHFHYI